jgi:transcriptional regulator of arginine metabolism
MPDPKPTLDQAILMLIERDQVPDQSSLIALLAREGHRTSQGSISRRLARLSVQKRDGCYRRVIPENHPLPPYSMVESPPNLLVLRSAPAFGMALAIRLDRSRVPGIAGTVAGEDTLLVILAAGATLAEVRARIVEILGPPT